MPMRKRTAYSLLFVVLLLCALAGALFLRQKAPPEAARLLPEADAIVFVNVKPLRLATHFDRDPISPKSFQNFIDATGILPERDIDSVAVALHRMPDARGPNGAVGYSEVFEGHFDRTRLADFLASQASAQESYGGRTIYALRSEGRLVRVALLSYDIVVASNMPTAQQIHSMLDRQRTAANPLAGPSVLRERFAEVPAFSSAWAVGALGMPFANGGHISVFGLDLPLPVDAPFVASLRFTPALHLRIDEVAASPEDASRDAAALNDLLKMARVVQRGLQPQPRTDQEQAMRELVDSIAIDQNKSRATLTATLPLDAVKQLAAKTP